MADHEAAATAGLGLNAAEAYLEKAKRLGPAQDRIHNLIAALEAVVGHLRNAERDAGLEDRQRRIDEISQL
jgi:hypothetical protein